MSNRTQEEQQRQSIATLEQRAREFQKKYEEMIESFATASLPLQRQAFECCLHCFDICGIAGEGGRQQQERMQTSSGGSGWGRLFGRSSTGQAASESISTAPVSAASAACASADVEERVGEKVHEKLTRCISGCHNKGEDVSRVVQKETDVLQSTLASCQKVCYSRFAGEKHATAREEGPLFTAEAEKCFMQCFSDAEPLMKEISARVHKRIRENI